jgi:regulator of ribonuclease activity A
MTEADFSTADLFDAQPDRIMVCDLQFRSFGKRLSFSGTCVTVSVIEDHRPVLAALEEAGRGRVLVVDGRGSLRIGLCGDRLAGIAATNGWAGLVVNGAIRDSRGIDALDIGVKALGTTARRSASPAPTERDVPVTFGGVTFIPGLRVYSDTDAVVCDLGVVDPPIAKGAI